jgi:hypothetical protein
LLVASLGPLNLRVHVGAQLGESWIGPGFQLIALGRQVDLQVFLDDGRCANSRSVMRRDMTSGAMWTCRS